jgi:hypothetical protein
MDGNDDFAERDALLLSEYPTGARNADRVFRFSTAYHIHEMPEQTSAAVVKGGRSMQSMGSLCWWCLTSHCKKFAQYRALADKALRENCSTRGKRGRPISLEAVRNKTEHECRAPSTARRVAQRGAEQGSRALLIRNASTDHRKMFHKVDSLSFFDTINSP